MQQTKFSTKKLFFGKGLSINALSLVGAVRVYRRHNNNKDERSKHAVQTVVVNIRAVRVNQKGWFIDLSCR